MSDLLNQASLVMVPSGYKEDTVYSVVPTDGSGDLSFTRASNGTRVNSAGLIEVCPWNLLEDTNTFSSWNLEGGTLTSGFTAPDGSSTAYKYVQIPGGGLYSANYGVTADVKFAQVWIKSVSGGSITVNLSDGSAFFGTFNVTGEWQLFTGQYTANTRIGLYLYSISNAQGIYVWHPQLNIGSTAKPYFPTTDRLNVPRLTYQNGGGGCPSLLLEKQSTNLVIYSNGFDNAAWNKNNITITANSVTSPDGTQNANTITDNTTNGSHIAYQFGNQTVGTAWSCYMKKGSLNYGYIGAVQSTTVFTTAIINLTNGSIVELQNGSSTTGSVTTEDCGNGWYRVKMQTNANGAGYSVGTSNGSALSGTYKEAIYTGTGSGTIYIWGAQLEDSSYPTSYIPTTSSSATRVADDITNTFLQSGGFLGSNTGAMFVSGTAYAVGQVVCNFVLTAQDNTTKSFLLDTVGVNTIRLRTWDASSNQQSLTSGTITGNYKLCVSWTSSTIKYFVNGSLIGTISQTTYPYTTIKPESTNYSNNIWGEVVFFPTNIADADAIALTS